MTLYFTLWLIAFASYVLVTLFWHRIMDRFLPVAANLFDGFSKKEKSWIELVAFGTGVVYPIHTLSSAAASAEEKIWAWKLLTAVIVIVLGGKVILKDMNNDPPYEP